MAVSNTLKFLPSIFQTDTNQKFLNATMDQLTSEADLRKVNGYIGRKFAPTYKSGDNYVTEPTALRKNYQLEPTVVVQDKSANRVDLFSSYVDLIQQLGVLGGNTTDHSRLFGNESYTFDGLFDFDKFSNYNNYYWIPEGPAAVEVFASTVPFEDTFSVTRNLANAGYNFSGKGTGANPALVLARGGTYKFNLNQLGKKFWIQTEPGTSGTRAAQSTVSTREIFGVQNNGASVGQITFTVPRASAQDAYSQMVLVDSVDCATMLSYNQIQNRLLSALLAAEPLAFDGLTTNLDKKTLIFVNGSQDEAFWETPGDFDLNNGGFDSEPFDVGATVPEGVRHGVWVVNLVLQDDGDYLVQLIPSTAVTPNQRVFIKSGNTFGTEEFYLGFNSLYVKIPVNTASLNRLYYQDGSESGLVGVIELVDDEGYQIDVANQIIGQRAYTSPNGVIFTNGLKISFDDTVTDPQYAGNEYYVEGVGKSIALVAVADLITPEAYAVNGIATQDYITISRHCIDANAWSRSNRWFHIDVINAAAAYNKTIPLPDQTQRATRPIIEFEDCLQLFNAGRVAKKPIDQLDFTITDAMNQVEGYVLTGDTATIGSLTITPGDRIIFANDVDPTIKNKIYVATSIEIDGGDNSLHLVAATDADIAAHNCVTVINGANKGKNYWYNGLAWLQGQLKTGVNQSPLFDVIDTAGNSIGDINYYPVSSFAGTALFSYTRGTGANDKVLGFPLSYRNFNSIGDIQFTNNFDTEVITYAAGQTTATLPVNTNFVRQNYSLTEFDYRNIWTKNVEETKQYQVFSFVYNGSTNYFPVDVLPEEEERVPYTKVFVNNKLLTTGDYEYNLVGKRQTIRINHLLLSADDKVDILIYSKTPSKTGYYEIPNSLDFNTKNASFGSLTLGQLRNHVKTIEQNTKQIVDIGSSFSGLRDIEYKSNGGSIVQQSAPAMYSNIFLTDKNLNFAQGLDLAAREYSRFKNKFLELSTQLDTVSATDIPASVDTILKSINSIKNKSFPWYYSDMVPYGDNANVITYNVINPFQYQYEITQVFNDAQLSSLAVLVYLDNVQLVKGVDFTFPQDRSAIIINKDAITLTVNSKLKIVEYYNTDGCFIPETPSKLGLYPKFIPSSFVDSSYLTPVTVIQGHDGSITPAFGDHRDALLLELEKRIYNNIKLDYDTQLFDIHNYLPGKFRTTDYSLKEFTQLLSTRFLRWVGDNQVNYTSNSTFNGNNAWTWNYKKFKDNVDGEFLPGTWRAIFLHFFDTYRPHTHPWEMLGFGQQPTWWEERYGAAPYTGSNQLLWDDLEAGYIHAGTRAGIDARFVRPGLSKVIPVDDYGSLLSPEQWATSTFNSQFANTSYAVGDQGPAEFAWRTSSSYPFAIQYALALAKPGVYFGSLINVDRYFRNTQVDQLINSVTRQRVTPASVVINGDTTSGTTVRSAGYLNWVRDYLVSLGIDPNTKIQSYLDNVDIQLGYKVGGYTDKKFIEVLAEQGSPTNTSNSIIVPTENYSIQLNESTPIRKVAYSAVVVQQTENGYTVNGYNSNNPYFTIIPSLVNNNFYTISALNAKAVVYKDYQSYKLTVPYGFEFTTKQDVVDFLIGYGRFLVAQGFQFNDQDELLGEQRNWALSAKEFLNWSQQGWKPGNLIILSPVNNVLRNQQPDGVVAKIENSPMGTKLLDQNANFIKNTDFTEVRNNNTFKVTANNGQTICFADFTIVQFEHSIIFDNVTVFNDILYVPELGNRQYRLKLIGSKTGSWTGGLNPPGFVYNNSHVDSWQPGVDYKLGSIVEFKTQYYTALTDVLAAPEFVQNKQWRLISHSDIKTGLLPNFAYNASRLEQAYDVDNLPADSTFEGYGTSLIGFRKRPYLTNFGLDETSQVKFYQGFIKDKGTMNAITGLTSASLDNLTSDIDLFEEWALRVGEYGALTSDRVLEIALNESAITANPTPVELLNKEDADSVQGVVGYRPVDLYSAPDNYTKNIFFNRSDITDTSNDIQIAGYVNLNDVNTTLFNFTSYADLDNVVSSIHPGYYIWVAKDFSDDWNVYRITETQTNITNLSYNIDSLVTVTFTQPPELSIGDVFVIKAFDSRFDGFYQVYDIDGVLSVKVIPHRNPAIIKDLKTVSGNGIYYKLQSARINLLSDAAGLLPANGWTNTDKLWVDNADAAGNWGVYEKSSAWNYKATVTDDVNQAVPNSAFGSSVATGISSTNIFVGMPSRNLVKVFARNSAGGITQVAKLEPKSNSTINYSVTMSASDSKLAVGAPNSNGSSGYVVVHDLATGSTQFIVDPDAMANDKFGTSVAISGFNDWLYVGAPNDNAVYVYYFDETVAEHSDTFTWTVSTHALAWTPASVYDLQIADDVYNYVPGVDFTLSGSTITFITLPAVGAIVSVTQKPCYRFWAKLDGADYGLVTSDKFGQVVATSVSGNDLLVGAPGKDSNAGAVYAFKLFTETFTSNLDTTYVSSKNITARTKVYVGDTLQVEGTDFVVVGSTNVTFPEPLPLSTIVTIISGDLELAQTIIEPDTYRAANNQFGNQIAIDTTTVATIFIGAPGVLVPDGQSGAVYRYSDTAKMLGSISGTNNVEYVKNLVINEGAFDSNIGLYINGYFVDLSSSITSFYSDELEATVTGYADPQACVTLINNANIPAVTASLADGVFFTITSSSVLPNNKLTVIPNDSNLFDKIGMSVYQLDQVITHPEVSTGSGFVKDVKYNVETDTLIVSSDLDSVDYPTSIDEFTTEFDDGATKFIDTVPSAGAVFVYDRLSDANTGRTNTGTMMFVDMIKSPSSKEMDQFGYAVEINNDIIIVGAPGDDSVVDGGGTVHAFTNPNLSQAWNLIRSETAKVDLDNINKIFVYNSVTDSILASLDYIDPAKGKILGIAEQDLDYKTALDPAVYNNATNALLSLSTAYHWNERQVGQIWWNLDALRYIDYEQDGLIYRSNNWGKTFPGSQVQVCEWVESKFAPSQYVAQGGDGVPLYEDNSAYVTVPKVIGGVVTVRYYFWVVNKQNAAKGKHYSTTVLADIIENPQLQGVPYAFMMKDNAFGLVNVAPYLSGSDTVLHIDYQKIKNSNSIHSEFALISENDSKGVIPDRILNKLIDSLSGIDQIGQVVPDPTLTAVNQLGISVRPRQTMIINRAKAVENFVKYVNGVLIANPIVLQYSLLGLEKQDPQPASTEYNEAVNSINDLAYIDTTNLPVGYKVLVTTDSTNSGLWTVYALDANKVFQTSRIQYFNTALYWSKVDWYAADYDPTSRINYTVTSYKDIATLTLVEGDVVRVNYDDNAQFAIYRVNSDLTLSKVGIQNGTIQLSNTLYDLAAGQMGWDEDRFDSIRFDQTPSIEVRNILMALRDDIFIGNLGNEFNKLFFVLVNYILQEQNSVDWIFKTSFVSIFHKLRELSQPPNYVLDNQDYYLDYINEVKPYRTIIREYVVDYTGEDVVGSNVTDFDLPSIYNKRLGVYRTPDGSLPVDSTLINTLPEYQYWKGHHGYTVSSIELSTQGSGYLVTVDPKTGNIISPSVTIAGGGGTGAVAFVSGYNVNTGAITGITVTNSGSGYTSSPRVIINGTGSGALAAARIVNNTVRQFDSVLKFDRVAYDSNVKIWNSADSYSSGDIVAFAGQAYQAVTDVPAVANFDFNSFNLLTGADVGNANDRIIAYIASATVENLDVDSALGTAIKSSQTNRYWLTQFIDGIDYPGVKVQGLPFTANLGDQALTDSIIQSRYIDTGLGTRPEDINIDGGAYIDRFSSHAPEEFVPGVVYDSVDISVFTEEVVSQANTTVVPDGVTFAYREFFDINSKHEYFRISGFSTAYLLEELTLESTTIVVNDSSSLPVPDLVRAVPGVLFIGGEKITYWENDTETNELKNIRRGVGGTSNQVHPVNTTVYDASADQAIPEINPREITISSNSSFSSNSSWNYWKVTDNTSVFSVADRPTYKLTLSSNITANVGDIITQTNSNANAVVRGNVVNSKTVAVAYNSGLFTTANANCVISVNSVVKTAYANAVAILGAVSANGTVTITSSGSNVTIKQDSLAWIDYDFRDQGLQFQDSGSLPARAFLGEGATTTGLNLDDYYSIEDEEVTVNSILITDNSQLIIKE